MGKSERDANPLPESLQMKSHQLQECKTVTVNGSSQAERKIQTAKRAAWNKNISPIFKGMRQKNKKGYIATV